MEFSSNETENKGYTKIEKFNQETTEELMFHYKKVLELLGEDVSVVSAFQNDAAHHLQDGKGISCDVLVCGNKKVAREAVITLVEAAGMRGFHAGMINNAAAAEALTSVLIVINKQYNCHAGITISGLDEG